MAGSTAIHDPKEPEFSPLRESLSFGMTSKTKYAPAHSLHFCAPTICDQILLSSAEGATNKQDPRSHFLIMSNNDGPIYTIFVKLD